MSEGASLTHTVVTHTVVLSNSCETTVGNGDQGSNQRDVSRKRLREKDVVVETPPQLRQKVSERFVRLLGGGPSAAQSLFDEIKKEQHSIRGVKHVAFHHLPTPLFPGFIVTAKDIHVLLKSAGKGAQAEASFSKSFPLSMDKSPKRAVVKIAKKPFTPQKKLLARLEKHDGIDVPGASGALISSSNRLPSRFAVFQRSDGDLNHINYSDPRFEVSYGAYPVPFITGQLISMAAGLEALHDAGLIHRDIKGPNALFNIGGLGKLTDTDLLMEELGAEKTHTVGTTPEYAAPYIWSDVTKQRVVKNRRLTSIGHQSKATDKFAFGAMIQTDVVTRVISGLSKIHHIENPLDLRPVKVVEKQYSTRFTDEEMLQVDREHSGRVVYRWPNPLTKSPGYLSKYPTREDACAKTFSAIDKLAEHLPAKELAALKQLACLAYILQDPDQTKMMSTADLVSALQAIGNQF